MTTDHYQAALAAEDSLERRLRNILAAQSRPITLFRRPESAPSDIAGYPIVDGRYCDLGQLAGHRIAISIQPGSRDPFIYPLDRLCRIVFRPGEFQERLNAIPGLDEALARYLDAVAATDQAERAMDQVPALAG